jgi:hypothetical protein
MLSASAPVPPVLYHYTNSTGLKGILETSSLWATDADFLNDAQELQFGRLQLCDALIAQAESLHPRDLIGYSADSSRAAILRSAVDYLRRGDVISRSRAEQVYVACFCDHDDLLSQWRGYGSSGGYAIGFRSESLPIPAPNLAEVPFIRSDGVIVRIAHRAQPLSERPIASGRPVRAVLEIAGGRAAELGVRPGDKVRSDVLPRGNH